MLRFSNWPLYIDFDEKTKKHPTLDQFTAKTGIKVDYFEDINSNAEYFGKIQRPLSQGQSIDRDIIVLTDNERFLGLMIDKGWVEELDKRPDPQLLEPDRRAGEPAVRPRPQVLAPVAVGHDRDRVERGGHRARHLDHAAVRGPEAEGQGHGAERMGDTPGLVMLDNGDDPSKVTDATWNAALDRIQKAVDSGQIRRFTGNDYAQPLSQGRPRGGGRVVGRHLPAALVEPEAEVGDPGRRAG